MAFEVAAELAELEQVLRREKAGFSPGCVEERGCVAFGKDETVVIVVMRIFGVVAHVGEEQRRHDVRR